MKIPRFFHLLPFLFVPVLVEASLIWPTPNPAFQNGKPIEAYVQATVSGRVESGLFGCVRNGGSRFHEGLDLYPFHPTDSEHDPLPFLLRRKQA